MSKINHCVLSLALIISTVLSSDGQQGPVISIEKQTGQRRVLTAPQIAKIAYASSVVVNASDKKGDLVAQASGFFVTPSVVVTNFHVIENADEISVELVGRRHRGYISRVIRFDDKSDLALLEVPIVKSKPIPVYRGTGVDVGDTVYAMGNPKGLDATFSSGQISAFREFNGVLHIQITAPLSAGSSGGAILNNPGELIGVVQSQLTEGQNLNFAIALPHLLILMLGEKGKGMSVIHPRIE